MIKNACIINKPGNPREGWTYVRVLLSNELQESVHVRSTEVVNRLETSEHAAVGDSLKVVLANILKEKISD